MADKKKSEINLFPYFVDGEQPSANKFNSIGIQISRNLYVIEKALGDIWNESEPYSSLDPVAKLSLGNSKLFEFGARNNSASKDKSYSLNIASLARIIGPSSKLNPLLLIDGLYEGGNTYLNNSQVQETIASGSKSYVLKHKVTSGSTITVEKNSTALTARNLADLNVDENEYYFNSEKGEIIFGSTTTADCEVIYTTTPSEYSGGPSYLGSSYNVIPDESQIENGTELIVTESNGFYEISLPKVSHSNISLTNENGIALSEEDPMYEAQLKLPAVLREMFGGDLYDATNEGTPDSLIPEGFVYLKNLTTNEVYTNGEYYYLSDTAIKVGSIELDNPSGDKFCLITVGTDITSSIQDLNFKNFKHSHDRSFGEAPISFKSLVGATEETTSKGEFYDSEIPGNYLPQYLHRDGWSSSVADGLNDGNAMRGHLLLGRSSGDTGTYVGSGSSYKLYFGNQDTSIARGSSSTLNISNKGDITSNGYDLNFIGGNRQNANGNDSNLESSNFTNYRFISEPNEYRSSATQRPGEFRFFGAPVYLQGLSAYTVTGQTSAETYMRLAKSRDEAVRSYDYTASDSGWFCPGIGIASIYLNDVKASADTSNQSNPLPAYYKIPLPLIGEGSEEQFVASGTSGNGLDVRVTVNQILSVSVLVKPTGSSYYVPVNGSPRMNTINGGHATATFNIGYESTPDSNVEYITIYFPWDHTSWLGHLGAIDSNSAGFPQVWLGDERLDIRVTIMYLTHR